MAYGHTHKSTRPLGTEEKAEQIISSSLTQSSSVSPTHCQSGQRHVAGVHASWNLTQHTQSSDSGQGIPLRHVGDGVGWDHRPVERGERERGHNDLVENKTVCSLSQDDSSPGRKVEAVPTAAALKLRSTCPLLTSKIKVVVPSKVIPRPRLNCKTMSTDQKTMSSCELANHVVF